MAAKNATGTTQQFVPIREVRDGVLIMRDGSMRAILMVSSVNFALKSHDEQMAILSQFQSFLNTLDFSIEIYVQSRRLNIRPYLELLAAREKDQDNDLMRIQLREYIEFIRTFTAEVDIMTKSFFVAIPYTPASLDVKRNINAYLSGQNAKVETDTSRFEEDRTQLEQRVSVVEQGLSRVGTRSIMLNTKEVVELFYFLFNPGEEGREMPNAAAYGNV